MRNLKSTLAFSMLIMLFYSCTKEQIIAPEVAGNSENINSYQFVYAGFPEGFESGSKGAYAVADVALSTGSWNFNDALIGTLASDRKNGLKSARIENSGILSMNFDATDGASQVSFAYAVYGTDASSTFELWLSVNGGSSWIKTGNTISASSTTLTTATFPLSITGPVRFQIRKLGGGRLNIDDFSIDDNSSAPTRDDNMALGNPSNATGSTVYADNYLMTKTQYVLSYNNSKGTPNWVSWHLSTAWKGTALRCDCFNIDNSLPSSFYHTSTSNYTNTGFDRGHQCPSEDRDGSDVDNSASFLMTNMMPQAPNLNRVTWVNLEDYCRTLMNSGNELYIVSGGYGSGGTGSNGGVTYNFATGHVNVPARFWKVIVVLPVGSNDVNRVTTTTRVIAVDMPNVQTVNSQAWGNYRVSVDAIEAATGYDFLSSVPASVQAAIEASADNGPTL